MFSYLLCYSLVSSLLKQNFNFKVVLMQKIQFDTYPTLIKKNVLNQPFMTSSSPTELIFNVLERHKTSSMMHPRQA